jgi:hypothetical protein
LMPAWIPCPCCGEFWCSRHGLHAFECDCPPIEDWEDDPYSEPPMPKAKDPNDRVQIRRSPDLDRKVRALAERWGPVKPLSISDVVREAVDRAYAAEFPAPGKKSR